MGLFDEIIDGIEAKDTQHAALYDEVGKLVNEAGGVSGLAQQFEQKGMGGLIAGWISNGQNPPITGQQVLQLVGHDRVMAMASKIGLSEEQVTAGVSKLLPMMVDHLTPAGTVPAQSTPEVQNALGDLKSKLLNP